MRVLLKGVWAGTHLMSLIGPEGVHFLLFLEARDNRLEEKVRYVYNNSITNYGLRVFLKRGASSPDTVM